MVYLQSLPLSTGTNREEDAVRAHYSELDAILQKHKIKADATVAEAFKVLHGKVNQKVGENLNKMDLENDEDIAKFVDLLFGIGVGATFSKKAAMDLPLWRHMGRFKLDVKRCQASTCMERTRP